jgi:hypothetical protein
MTGRNLLHNAALADFLGDFAPGPMRNWSLGVGWRFTG